ncbi:MAG TPA: FAD-binding oxidoreductase [Candidatus Binatia bacterium]|nr:FAD-binding oxidoreductase [Candidatus Binatia bacterium]
MIATRVARGEGARVRVLTSSDDVLPFLDDAAHYPGGHASAVYLPESEAEVAAVLRESARVTVSAAQSSLTGGATPQGGVVLSLTRMNRIRAWSEGTVRVEAGVVLSELDRELRRRNLYYPPIPTYDGATVGGTVATNAAGAATFKYGSTRDWVEAITVVLVDGDVLELRRGQCVADDGRFELACTSGRRIVVPLPSYRVPDVPKRSAGYHAAPGMDLVDLFIGSEGTLGVVTEIELRVLEGRPAWFCGLVPMANDDRALALVAALRTASKETWRAKDAHGIDVAAVEYLDRRCLELLSEDHFDAQLGFSWPDDAGAALIFQAELPADATRDGAFSELEHLDDPSRDTRLLRICRLLVEHEVFDVTAPILPGETARRDALLKLREAVPAAVNRRIRERQREIDPSISKSGGDVIVPFERIGESLRVYREILARRGLDHAIWGHISDGNFHPNVLPASREQMVAAKEAQLEIGRAAIALGGCPLSEHGVGRNPVKQALLRELYGESGIGQMRAVKRALDPSGKLAPGVLFGE